MTSAAGIISPRSRQGTAVSISTPTPPPRPALTLPIGQPQKASGPSLLEKLAELERREKEETTPRSKPALPKPSPQPGQTIVKKAAPSLFIERKKPRKPAQKPAQTQPTPNDKGKEKDDKEGTDTDMK